MKVFLKAGRKDRYSIETTPLALIEVKILLDASSADRQELASKRL
jgi:hypothetical protein